MTIHFSTIYDENHNKPSQTNTKYLGTLGLLSFLERELGLYEDYLSDKQRVILYKNALENKEVSTVFDTSFQSDKLKVAATLLSYRDELIQFGWDFQVENQPKRLQHFAYIEKEFINTAKYKGISDRLQLVKKRLTEQTYYEFSIDSLVIVDREESLNPLILETIKLLTKFGVNVSCHGLPEVKQGSTNLGQFKTAIYNSLNDLPLGRKQLNEEDDSLLLFNFSNQQLLDDCIAYVADPKNSICINANNVGLDYSLVSFNKPASGSKQLDAFPQLTQIVKLIIPCFNGQLDLNILLSFLIAPYSPIDFKLRYRLARSLSRVPGVDNDNWNEIIKDYLTLSDLDIEEDEAIKVSKYRKKQIDLFLEFNTDQTKALSKAKKILSYLRDWSSSQQSKRYVPELKSQFKFIESLCADIIETFDFETNTTKGLESFIKEFYTSNSFVNYQKQINSNHVYGAINAITSVCNKKVFWMDFESNSPKVLGDFLLESEKAFLSQYTNFYNAENQIKHHLSQDLSGLLNCNSSLLLCRVGSNLKEKHQFHLMLETFYKSSIHLIEKKITSSSDFMKALNINTDDLIKSAKIEIPKTTDYFKSDALKHIVKRDVESASSIETFIQYPFDWVMKYIGKYNINVGLELADDNLTKGNVSHKVIELLFEDSKALSHTKEQIDLVFDKVIKEEGATFLQVEKRFDLSEFRYRFHKSYKTLVDFIKQNKFSVKSCEYAFGKSSDCIVAEALGKVQGFIDLYLEDEKGHPFIIDLKWEFSDKKYIDKITNNESIQLALYTAAINERDLSRTAYVLLNQNSIITGAKGLKGAYINTIDADTSNHNVLQKIKNSIEFRWLELKSGQVELGDDLPLNELYYTEDDGNKIKLVNVNKNKKSNPYSGYKLFKGNLI